MSSTDRPDEFDALEREIAELLASEGERARRGAAPPSSARVWWRAQMRARQEAALKADRPITFVHALAIACGIGLVLGVGGIALTWLRGADRLTPAFQSIAAAAPPLATTLANPWIVLPMTAMLVLAFVAVYVIFADE